jgi:hypothetical protein
MMELLSRTSALERGDEKENCGGAAGTLGDAQAVKSLTCFKAPVSLQPVLPLSIVIGSRG